MTEFLSSLSPIGSVATIGATVYTFAALGIGLYAIHWQNDFAAKVSSFLMTGGIFAILFAMALSKAL